MLTTPISALPYPEPDDEPDIPGAVYALTEELDPMVKPSFDSARGRTLTNASLNTIFDAGIYSGTHCFFGPEGTLDKFVLQVIPFDSANAIQTIFLLEDSSMWVRFALGGTWGTWKRTSLT